MLRGSGRQVKPERLDSGIAFAVIAADIGHETVCQEAVRRTIDEFGRLDILVNNAAEQHPQDSIADAALSILGIGFA